MEINLPTLDVVSLPEICATFSMTPQAIRAGAAKINLRPVLTIDGVEHFASEDMPLLRAALGLDQNVHSAADSLLLSELVSLPQKLTTTQ